MKSSFVKAAVAAALATGAMGAHALVLDFDDLSGWGPFEADYVAGGVSFTFGTNVFATNDWLFDDLENVYNKPVSGTWVGTSCGGPFPACDQALIRDSQPVISSVPMQMNSVYLSGSDPFGQPLTLKFKLYDAANVAVATETFVVFGADPVQYDFAYTGLVSKFVVNGVQAYYAMDNLDVTPVPEPGTYALMAMGMALVGAAVRRRKAG